MVSVTLFGATHPFQTAAVSDARGRFRFRRLPAGAYTVAAFLPGRGEIRETFEVGPATADARGRVRVRLEISDSKLVVDGADKRNRVVSARELSIPARARREYDEARRRLGQRDTAGAIAHLERAVELAPQYAEAWNNLGTIAYQSQRYEQAAGYFRRALEQDLDAYEPLVNLGGALLSLRQPREALEYNRRAARRRPQDALAHSQLGLNYLYLGELDRAVPHLETAKRLDPAHFSHPQLALAEIHMQRGNQQAAAAELEDFLRRHPDDPGAGQWRRALERLRGELQKSN